MKEKIAIVGMGQMGSGVARRLKNSGLDVVGFDINADTRVLLRSEGLRIEDTLSSLIDSRSIVLTSLPDPSAVRDVLLGEEGLIAKAARGTTIIELSTIDPETILHVSKSASQRGIKTVDCPVSGSPKEAEEGNLVLLVGGEKNVIDDIEPLLNLMGKMWKHTGPVGTAKVVKIVNNMMSMGNVLVAAEAFALGAAAGVDPKTLYDVLSVSGGRSHHFNKRFPAALEGQFDPGFKMELGEKDIALGVELGRVSKMPTPIASIVREMYAIALTSGYRGKDIVALLDMYNNWERNR